MKRFRKTAVWILALFLFTGTRYGIPFAEAAFDETEAVHINAGEIEDATIAIGTHLISLHAMNDTIYGIAVQSAEESGQQKIYYKSELGNSGWYDISGASSLDAICPKGNAVEIATIQELFFTHHTRSDGITYDLRTSQAVNLLDIVSPYDVDKIPELDSFRNQYQALEKRKADTGLLDDFLEEERNRTLDESMQNCNSQLARLQSFYQSLAGSGRQQSELAPVLQIMEKIDAQRRFASYTRIKAGLEELMDHVSEDAALGENADLQEALGDCLKKLQSRLDELEGRRREEGETALSRTEYQLEQELLEAVENGAGNSVLEELSALYHVRDGIHVDMEQEKAFLDERLLPIAEQLYETTGDRIAENEWKYYETLREQLDTERQENPEILRLQEELDRLKAEKGNALDENDLARAAELEQQFLDTSASLQSLENDGIYGPESMMSKIQEQKEETLKLIHGPDSSMEELQTYVEGMQALCTIYPGMAFAALEEISEEMYIVQSATEGSTIYDTLIDQCDEVLEASADTGRRQDDILHILTQESGCVITEDRIDGDLTEQNLALCTLSAYCEQSQEAEAYRLLEQLSSALAVQDESSVFRVLSIPGRDGSDTGREQYAPAEQVAAWCSLRYVWSEDRREAVLAKGSRYYIFTAFDDLVLREKGQTETLPAPAPFQRTVYLPGSYVEENFSCRIQELAGTGYGIIVDQSVQEMALEICKRLL